MYRQDGASQLPHTERIAELLRAGKKLKAASLHNQRVKEQFKLAEQGEIINLSDLMAAKEELHLADAGRLPRAEEREPLLARPPVIVHTHADGGSVRIYNAGLAAHFHAGSGDGCYEVHIYTEGPPTEQDTSAWQYVDCFEVTAPAWLADCDSHSPASGAVYEFGPGKWFVYHCEVGRTTT